MIGYGSAFWHFKIMYIYIYCVFCIYFYSNVQIYLEIDLEIQIQAEKTIKHNTHQGVYLNAFACRLKHGQDPWSRPRHDNRSVVIPRARQLRNQPSRQATDQSEAI